MGHAPPLDEHVHSPEGADDCFGCKMAYVRSSGGLGVHYSFGGREAFHGPTIRERQERAVTEARENGYDPTPVGTRWV